jgi:hypothetical protein
MNKAFGSFKQPLVDDTTDKEEEFQHCECEENDPCGNDTGCLNRLLMYECSSKICRNDTICKNQRFKRREYVNAAPFKTDAGWGLKALEDVQKGQFVMEYCGELIDEEECHRRLKDLVERGDSNFYFLTIDRDTIIDAGPKGNLSRFMNHSCNPNCETQKWVVNNQTRVGLFAITAIKANTELTFNYNLESRGHEKIRCLCGAANCSGFIGVQPKKLSLVQQSTAQPREEEKHHGRAPGVSESSRKRRIAKRLAAVHEDECFRCGEPGKLVMCDKKSCPKAYHVSCLGLAKTPNGHWTCPWHHCDVCGRNAFERCDHCPLSLCKEHSKSERLEKLANGYQLCYEHVNRPTVKKHLLSLPDKRANATMATNANDTSNSSKQSTSDSKSSSEEIKTPNQNLKRKSIFTAEDRAARLLRRSKANEEASPRERSPKKFKKETEPVQTDQTTESSSSTEDHLSADLVDIESKEESSETEQKISNGDEQMSESSEGHKENNLDGDNVELNTDFSLIAPKQILIEGEDSLNIMSCDSITGDQLIKSTLIEQQMETCS